MESVAGIFTSRAAAEEAVHKLRSLGLSEKRIVLLTPGTKETEVESTIRTTDAESPGIGTAMGGAVGAALGVAGGATLGAATASLLVPGVGPILAAGILGAAVLGLGGTAAGMAAGHVLEDQISDGLPHDEVYIYEDALRKGRSVVIAFPDDDDLAERVRNVLAQSGAESIDAAREDWWLGIRDAEEEYYQAASRDFKTDEVSYRRGFQAALNTKLRGKTYEEAAPELKRHLDESGTDEAFRQGYERGLDYQKRHEADTSK